MNHPFSLLRDEPAGDYRGEPTLVCPCGSVDVCIVTRFDEETRLPGFYLLDGMCAVCGALLTLPTPIDDRTEGSDDA